MNCLEQKSGMSNQATLFGRAIATTFLIAISFSAAPRLREHSNNQPGHRLKSRFRVLSPTGCAGQLSSMLMV
jgi:hypothetical protein